MKSVLIGILFCWVLMSGHAAFALNPCEGEALQSIKKEILKNLDLKLAGDSRGNTNSIYKWVQVFHDEDNRGLKHTFKDFGAVHDYEAHGYVVWMDYFSQPRITEYHGTASMRSSGGGQCETLSAEAKVTGDAQPERFSDRSPIKQTFNKYSEFYGESWGSGRSMWLSNRGHVSDFIGGEDEGAKRYEVFNQYLLGEVFKNKSGFYPVYSADSLVSKMEQQQGIRANVFWFLANKKYSEAKAFKRLADAFEKEVLNGNGIYGKVDDEFKEWLKVWEDAYPYGQTKLAKEAIQLPAPPTTTNSSELARLRDELNRVSAERRELQCQLDASQKTCRDWETRCGDLERQLQETTHLVQTLLDGNEGSHPHRSAQLSPASATATATATAISTDASEMEGRGARKRGADSSPVDSIHQGESWLKYKQDLYNFFSNPSTRRTVADRWYNDKALWDGPKKLSKVEIDAAYFAINSDHVSDMIKFFTDNPKYRKHLARILLEQCVFGHIGSQLKEILYEETMRR